MGNFAVKRADINSDYFSPVFSEFHFQVQVFCMKIEGEIQSLAKKLLSLDK